MDSIYKKKCAAIQLMVNILGIDEELPVRIIVHIKN